MTIIPLKMTKSDEELLRIWFRKQGGFMTTPEQRTKTIEECIKAVWDAGGDNTDYHCGAIREAMTMTTTPEEIPAQMVNAANTPVKIETEAIQEICEVLNPFNWAAQERIMTFVRSRCAHEFKRQE